LTDTFESRLRAANGRPSGFDYLRVVLASAVLGWHVIMTGYGDEFQNQLLRSGYCAPVALVLPMFFALSGFLVAGSLDRSNTLITFLGLRAFRIVPALAVEVFLSALILGPLLTTLSLREYFTHPTFLAYFLNVVGEIHYFLPGVFENNPNHFVNGQLWTVPFELLCYVLLSALAVFGLYARPKLLLIVLLLFYIAQVFNTLLRPHSVGIASGPSLVMMFLAGVAAHKLRTRIVSNWYLFAASLVASLVLLSVPNGDRFAAMPVAYVTVYLGLFNPPRNKVILSGDYSYGLFLYGYPIQQSVVAIFGVIAWYYNILIAIPCAIVVAVASWWLVEKPILNYRGVLKDIEKWAIARFARFSRRSVAALAAESARKVADGA